MKYISSYKIFENSDEVVRTIEDIALDIRDLGFDVLVRKSVGDASRWREVVGNTDSEIFIKITKKAKFGFSDVDRLVSYRIEEIQDVIVRICDYSKSIGYSNTIYVPVNGFTGSINKYADYNRNKTQIREAIISNDTYPTYINRSLDGRISRYRLDYNILFSEIVLKKK